MLILDEPTAGLDPKQIIEIRELLKHLAGDHTIILSTHILSEVEHSCERVIIISQGKLVAIDSVANLTNRLRGSEAVALEVEAADGSPNPGDVQQRLEQVAGVSRVVMKDSKDGRLTLRSGKPARPPHPRRPGPHRGQLRLEPERAARRRPEPGRHLPATHQRRRRRRIRPRKAKKETRQ